MYDFIQSALTATIEAIAIIGLTGIFAHALYTQHQRFTTEFCPQVKPYTVPKPEAITKTVEAVKEVMKPRQTHNKKVPQLKLQPLSVGAAAIDYTVMTSEQLRKECALQGIEWRSGGDYGRPMKKAQMVAALR